MWGHEVQFAQSGYRAIELAREFRPTVALLDIGLPGMDGYELARQLRKDPPSSPLTLIALTGYGQEDDRRRTSDAGFDHHLTKPANLQALFDLINN
jgi:CheY-like chemotaxis protein